MFAALIPLLAAGIPPVIDMFTKIIATIQSDPATTADQQAALADLAAHLDETNAKVQAVSLP